MPLSSSALHVVLEHALGTNAVPAVELVVRVVLAIEGAPKHDVQRDCPIGPASGLAELSRDATDDRAMIIVFPVPKRDKGTLV